MSPLKPERPLVSVIIPCRNEADHIEECLRSVLAQEIPEGGFEVLVADGMSTDGTCAILQRLVDGRWKMEDGGPTPEVGGQRSEVCSQSSNFRSPISDIPAPSAPPRLRVIDNPGRIAASGLNAAIRAGRGEIIIRIDSHTEYAPDYVCQCVATLERTGADNVGGPARTRAETCMEKAVAAAYHSPFSVGGARFHDVNYEGFVDTVTYGCWHRHSFERFGYFDEEFVRNQDDEHNLRIIRGGGKIYQSPNIRSWYRPRGSLKGLFQQYMQYGYWKVRVIQKHKLPASWRHLVPAAFLLALALLFLLSVFSFLLSAFAPAPWSRSPVVLWSLVRSVSHFGFQLPAFSLLLILASYLFAVLTASVITAARSEWKLLPVLPLVFPCYHFGYGYGFLRGIGDFIICTKGPRKTFGSLTR